MIKHDTSELVPLPACADYFGLPATWLRTEADAGRIPMLRAGRRRLFNLDAVRRVLADRAARGGAADG